MFSKTKVRKKRTISNPFKAGRVQTVESLGKHCRLISCFGVFAKRYLDCLEVEDKAFVNKYKMLMEVVNNMSSMYEKEDGGGAMFDHNLDVIEQGIEKIESYLDSRRENDKYKFLLLVSGVHYIFEKIEPNLHYLNTVEIMKKAEIQQKKLSNNYIAKKYKKAIKAQALDDVAESRKTYKEFLRIFQKSDTLGKDKSMLAFIEHNLLT